MNHTDLTVWMERALPAMLPAFLPERRWFGGKARPIAGVEFEDAAWVRTTGGPRALVVVRVRDTAGEQSRYVMLLAFVREPGPLPVIGRVDGAPDALWAIEAAADGSTALALLAGFSAIGASDLPTLRGGALQYRDAGEDAVRVLNSGPSVQPLGAEQSNTSLRINRTLAFKLFRKLEHGENPELEIGRFLATRTSFRDMPFLRGSLTYVSALGLPATLGVLQDWIESRGDGWSHVTALLRQRTDQSVMETLQADAFSLGVTTEHFHQALSTGRGDAMFAPEPVTRADVESWKTSVGERLVRTADLIGRHMESWPQSTRALAETFVAHSRGFDGLRRVPDPEQSPFNKIRLHGDYHLGQTLKTASGFVVIDFEGEPARPLAERRAKQPALRDIAGMLRSFDYAVEAARGDSEDRADSPSIAHALRRRFLDGYRAPFGNSPPEFAPADPGALGAWIDFFELDKALYEVEYEINNRPTWVHIPLRGIVRIANEYMHRENNNAQAPDRPKPGGH